MPDLSKNGSSDFTFAGDVWNNGDLQPERPRRAVFSHDVDTVEIALTPGSTPPAAPGSQAAAAGPKAEPAGESIPPRAETDRLRRAREAMAAVEARHAARAARAEGDRNGPARRPADDRLTAVPLGSEKDASGGEPIPREVLPEQPAVLLAYTPDGNPLLEQVTVRPWPARYSFYARFRADAKAWFSLNGEPCEPVPFFSYTPQYAQFSPEQKNYYLFWRSRVREGDFRPADYAYVLLFLYEIINLPDRIPPQEGIALLCSVWRAYRGRYPKLDRLLAEWVCDYGLIHRVAPPAGILDPFWEDVLNAASLKEYYIGLESDAASPYASALFACASYRWRTSKFLTEENRPLFEKHIRSAVLYAFSRAERERLPIHVPVGRAAMTAATVTRDAFPGALCAYDVKRRVEVRYLACSRSVDLRYAATDAVKYAENRVRGLLGIRSRFHTPNLPLPLRRLIDDYFAPLKKGGKKPEAAPPEYEKLYEPEHTGFSLSLAKTLEEQAWATAERLAGSEEPAEPETPAPPAAPEPAMPAKEPKDPAGREPWLIEALSCCLEGDRDGFARVAKARNLLPDALALAINDRMLDVLSDTAVEDDGNGYQVVPDYREEILSWITLS